MTSGVTVNTSASLLDDDSSPARIIRAAVSAIATHGIDHVTASQLIDGAQVARSTMYSYFGDVYGVFAELWRAAGAQWFDEITSGEVPGDGVPVPVGPADGVPVPEGLGEPVPVGEVVGLALGSGAT